MDFSAIFMNSLWAGLYAAGQAILLTAPLRYVPGTVLCGFAGRWVRDVLMIWGLSQNWSTVAAAATVVLVAVTMIRDHGVSPVVLISGVLPLGAAVAMFNAIIQLMKVSSQSGEALSASSVILSASIGRAFTTSLAISLGLGIGIAVTRLLRREEILRE